MLKTILVFFWSFEKQPPDVFCKNRCSYFFAKFTEKNRPKACNFIKKETLAQVFSCEFYEISKNIFFTEHLPTTVTVI